MNIGLFMILYHFPFNGYKIYNVMLIFIPDRNKRHSGDFSSSLFFFLKFYPFWTTIFFLPPPLSSFQFYLFFFGY
jgi:hypothetical protein